GGFFWRLADVCRVEDLALIDENYQEIALARKEGLLAKNIPLSVVRACEQIVDEKNYPGDFLASLIGDFSQEFSPWEGKGSWIKKPFTLYRDRYLDALWLLGQHYADLSEHSASREELCAKAAGLYEKYAMHACKSRLDLKVFWQVQAVGERV